MVEDVKAARSAQAAEDRLKARMTEITGRLEDEAKERVGKRDPIEKRWIEDLQQYHGRYDSSTEDNLRSQGGSRVYLSLTRAKTDAMEARLMDLLHPTDDRNWAIRPTPVPELTQAAQEGADAVRQMREQTRAAEEQGNPAEIVAAQEALKAAESRKIEIDAVMAEAKRRCEAMEMEIDDQLTEGRYQAINRDLLHDACKLGTGVLKGPVTGMKLRQGWKQVPVADEMGNPVLDANGKPTLSYELDMAGDDKPAPIHVDLWNFFPDPDARNIHEGEGVFERHLMNKKKLRGLARLGGFDKDAIRRLIDIGPKGGAPSYLADLRNITASSQQITSDLYHVWEYNGPLDAEDMKDLALALDDEMIARDMLEVDPLVEVNAVVWFCQGEVLKFAIYPLDSGEPLYSVFTLFADEASIFGYGIPSVIRHPQAMLNGAARMLMDNAGLSTGPQIVIDTAQIEPDRDGDYKLVPRKRWRRTGEAVANVPAFEAFNIDSHIQELLVIMEMAMRFIDELASIPKIAQGEDAASTTKTMGGMTILMNSANIVFRRIVKNYDDDLTVPTIRRWYDFNMQFSDKEHIKGDFEVDARGSSVLLVREMQAANLVVIALQFGAHPIYGPMLKNRDLLRKLFQASMIPADEVMLSDDEIDTILMKTQAEAEQGNAEAEAKMAELDFRREELDAKIAIAEMEADSRLRIEALRHESAMIQFAETMNMKSEELDARLQQSREAHAAKERTLAVELADKARTGVGAGGMV